MKDLTTQLSSPFAEERRPSLKMPEGVEVEEQELGRVTAQRMYQLRCECMRPWFELELPRLVKCPSCGKLSIVYERSDEDER